MMASDNLYIGAWLSQSRVNGPGCRFVLWLQGCTLRCPGCCNPEFQYRDSGHVLTIQDVYGMILATPDIEGVTYSGGEPFEQTEGLYRLSVLLREAGLTVMAYSGYTYEALQHQHNFFVDGLLSQLDILVDGPFVAQHAASLLWRGSRNQRVLFLTDRYQTYAADIEREYADVEFCIEGDTISITGAASDVEFHDVLRKLQLFY